MSRVRDSRRCCERTVQTHPRPMTCACAIRILYIFFSSHPYTSSQALGHLCHHIYFLCRSLLFAPPLWQLEWEKVKIRITTNGPMCANESFRDNSTCGAYISDRHSSLHWFQLATAASADNLPPQSGPSWLVPVFKCKQFQYQKENRQVAKYGYCDRKSCY